MNHHNFLWHSCSKAFQQQQLVSDSKDQIQTASVLHIYQGVHCRSSVEHKVEPSPLMKLESTRPSYIASWVTTCTLMQQWRKEDEDHIIYLISCFILFYFVFSLQGDKNGAHLCLNQQNLTANDFHSTTHRQLYKLSCLFQAKKEILAFKRNSIVWCKSIIQKNCYAKKYYIHM